MRCDVFPDIVIYGYNMVNIVELLSLCVAERVRFYELCKLSPLGLEKYFAFHIHSLT